MRIWGQKLKIFFKKNTSVKVASGHERESGIYNKGLSYLLRKC